MTANHLAKAIGFVLALSIPANALAEDQRPKLVVQLTVDQLPSGYLQRFAPALDDGFAEVLENGTSDIDGEVDHAITNSAPGHATLSTGSYPATHGYSANEWWDFVDGKWTWIDGAADSASQVLGEAERTGYSPINMKVPALGDWIISADPQSKSVAIGASEVTVMYAGKRGQHAYWYDREAGRFITSSHYRDEHPDWVDRFNRERLPAFKLETWELNVPEVHLGLADSDDRPYESFGEHYTFPHRFADEFDPDHERDRQTQLDYWFYETPMADIATIALAKQAIRAEELGQRDHTDYLSIALGASDNIGHIYGGYSLEALDMMIRIDRELGELITFLDSEVGKGKYVLAISSDHGAPAPIERTLEAGQDAYRIPNEEIDALLDRVDQIGNEHKGNRQELIDKIERELEGADFIEDAITEDEIFGRRATTNPLMPLFRKSWVRGRIPDFPLWTSTPNRIHHPARYGIFAQFRENTYFSYGVVVHGSAYDYDRTVPVIFYGAGVTAGTIDDLKTTDVAPTLAWLVGLEAPGFVDGKVVTQVAGTSTAQ